MKSRLVELALVIAVVAIGVSYAQKSTESARPEPAASAVSQPLTPPTPFTANSHTLSLGDPVPDFSLSDPAGVQVHYKASQGPILIVLTATGCQGCLERISTTDRLAHEQAKALGLPVWNLLVYQGVAGASDFVASRKPTADAVLCDPDSGVSVRMLGGSDATCWLLINKQGQLVWRGPAEPAALEKALAQL